MTVRHLLVALGLALGLAATSRAQTEPRALSPVDRAVTAARTYAAIEQYFAHWSSATDVDAAFRRYMADALAASDRRAFALASLRFVASLHNGHTQFVDQFADSRPLKFRLVDLNGQWTVVSTADPQLHRGDTVTEIDGRPIADVVADYSQYVAASNDRLARAHVFSYPVLFGDTVSLHLTDGRTVIVDRRLPGGGVAAPVFESRWLIDRTVGYVRIPGFGDPSTEQAALQAVTAYRAASAMIVDVRGNGGGATPRQLIAALMNRPWRTWNESGAQSLGMLQAQGSAPVIIQRPSRVVQPAPDAYAGRLLLLVDRFCGSACEDFVMPFKTTGRGELVGETTQGSSGNPYREDLDNGFSLAIGAVRYSFPDGAPFEGVGIVPDVAVNGGAADLRDGKDPVLERATMLASAAIAQRLSVAISSILQTAE